MCVSESEVDGCYERDEGYQDDEDEDLGGGSVGGTPHSGVPAGR